MYIYFDSNGVIKEIVNDVAIRKGSADYNKLYVYIEGNPEIDDIWYFQKFPNGSTSNEVSFVDDVVIKSIPYDAKRDMKYFKDFVQYKFYVFTLTSEYLNISGLAIGTIRIAIDNSIFALGELTFNIQANEVNADNGITQSQYNYLLLAYASRTLSEYTSRDLENYIDYIINAKVEELNPLQPSGTGTTAYITSQTSDIGILISTDNGHWYYWNGTQYADGGNYQAPFYNSSNKLDADYVDDTSSTHKFVTASEKAQIGTNATHITELQNYKADRNNASQTIKANKIVVNKVISLYDTTAFIEFEQEAGFVISTPNDDFFVNSQTGGIVGRDTYNGTYYAFRLEEGKFNITGTGIHYYENGNQMATQIYVDSTTGHTIELSLDSTNYQITAVLKNSSGTVISTSVFSVADLISGLQSEITAQNKLSSDLVDDTNATNKFVTASEKAQIGTNATAIANTYTKAETNTLLSEKADLNNSLQNFVANTSTANTLIAKLGLVVGSAFNTEGYVGIQKDENSDKYQLFRYKLGTTTKIDIPEKTGTMALTSDIVANPTLAGTESNLTSIGINGINYKVEEKKYYHHYFDLTFVGHNNCTITIKMNTPKPDSYTISNVKQIFDDAFLYNARITLYEDSTGNRYVNLFDESYSSNDTVFNVTGIGYDEDYLFVKGSIALDLDEVDEIEYLAVVKEV